jgi:hypothetical protein
MAKLNKTEFDNNYILHYTTNLHRNDKYTELIGNKNRNTMELTASKEQITNTSTIQIKKRDGRLRTIKYR